MITGTTKPNLRWRFHWRRHERCQSMVQKLLENKEQLVKAPESQRPQDVGPSPPTSHSIRNKSDPGLSSLSVSLSLPLSLSLCPPSHTFLLCLCSFTDTGECGVSAPAPALSSILVSRCAVWLGGANINRSCQRSKRPVCLPLHASLSDGLE